METSITGAWWMATRENPRRANGARRNKVLAWLRNQGRPCWICGHGIDYGLPKGDPRAFECDELIPVSQGGSPYSRDNVAPTHRCCNNWRRTKSVSKVQAIAARVQQVYGSADPQDFVAKAKVLERDITAGAGKEPIKTTTAW